MLATFAIPLVLGALAPATRTDEPESWTELFASAGAPLAAMHVRDRYVVWLEEESVATLERAPRWRQSLYQRHLDSDRTEPCLEPGQGGSRRRIAYFVGPNGWLAQRPAADGGEPSPWVIFDGERRELQTVSEYAWKEKLDCAISTTTHSDVFTFATTGSIHWMDVRNGVLDWKGMNTKEDEKASAEWLLWERNSSAPSRPGPDPSRRTLRPGRVRARWIAAGARREVRLLHRPIRSRHLSPSVPS